MSETWIDRTEIISDALGCAKLQSFQEDDIRCKIKWLEIAH
jgi:hypothetical protein